MSSEENNTDIAPFINQSNSETAQPNTPATQGQNSAEEDVLELLEANRGQYLTAPIAAPVIDYSESHVRSVMHSLADSDETDVNRERRQKEIYGVIVGNDFVVLTNDREQLLNIVRTYDPDKLNAARAMSNDELRSFIIDEIAAQEVTSTTDVLYFGIPE